MNFNQYCKIKVLLFILTASILLCYNSVINANEHSIHPTLQNTELTENFNNAKTAGTLVLFIFHSGSNIDHLKHSQFSKWAKKNIVVVDQYLSGKKHSLYSKHFGVKQVPTLLLLDRYGNKLSEVPNYADATYLISHIENIIHEYKNTHLLPKYNLKISIDDAKEKKQCLLIFKPKDSTQVLAIENGLFKSKDFALLANNLFEVVVVLPNNNIDDISTNFATEYIHNHNELVLDLIDYSNNKPTFINSINLDKDIKNVLQSLSRELKDQLNIDTSKLISNFEVNTSPALATSTQTAVTHSNNSLSAYGNEITSVSTDSNYDVYIDDNPNQYTYDSSEVHTGDNQYTYTNENNSDSDFKKSYKEVGKGFKNAGKNIAKSFKSIFK